MKETTEELAKGGICRGGRHFNKADKCNATKIRMDFYFLPRYFPLVEIRFVETSNVNIIFGMKYFVVLAAFAFCSSVFFLPIFCFETFQRYLLCTHSVCFARVYQPSSGRNNNIISSQTYFNNKTIKIKTSL